MKVLLSILREMAELPSDPSAIRVAMDRLGLAVEGMNAVGESIDGVVTARILRMEKHPEAARVTRVWVDAGDGLERHIWCGATNMAVGDVVPLALPGTLLPDGRAIGKRGILGIESEGMLCAASEIGLADTVDGLLILAPDAPLGRDPLSILGIERDVIFDLDLTRNRPDCWGHLGVARDLAAHFGVDLRGPSLDHGATGSRSVSPIRIDAPEDCGVFTATVIENVRVLPSPRWIVERLERMGMRGINNVVDASNLVMLECNQPNHAYDAEQVGGFVIRRGTDGETLTTLDGITRVLSGDDLVICDTSSTPIGLAGIMGGLDSEVTEETTTLVLEVAWFLPDSARLGMQRHGLRSEAGLRFERGVDPEGHGLAVKRFMTILRETCPDAALGSITNEVRTQWSPGPREIALRARTVERSLGLAFEEERLQGILEPIGFACSAAGDVLYVTTPTFRPDCVEEIDLVEEIARHIGYDNLGATTVNPPGFGRLTSGQQRRRLLRQVLVGLGLDEAMPSPFLTEATVRATGLDSTDSLRLSNPLVADESLLRTSLRPGLLQSIAYNISHRATRVGLWEIGHVYPPGTGVLPDEAEWLCVLVLGDGAETALREWNVISDALGFRASIDQTRVPAGLHDTRSAVLSRGAQVVGHVGEISPLVLSKLGIGDRVSCLELDLSIVLAEAPGPSTAVPINRHPTSDLDLSFVCPDEVRAEDLAKALRRGGGQFLVSVNLVDAYRGDEIGRSLTFRLRLQKPSGTLVEGEIAAVRDKCIDAATRLGVVLRS